MDNFFKFLDNLNQSILLLYDNNFFYTNHHLLKSLEYNSLNRPVSLKQIINNDWLQELKKNNSETENEIKLITSSGTEKPFNAKLFPFQFDKSDCRCFIIKPKYNERQNEDIFGFSGNNSVAENNGNGLVKSSILQSLKRLKELNKGDEKFTHINWEEIDSEINNIKKLFKDYSPPAVQSVDPKHIQINLYQFIRNEIEILKSNEIFRYQAELMVNLEEKIISVRGEKYVCENTIRLAIERIVKEACNMGMFNIEIKSFAFENTVQLKIVARAADLKEKEIPSIDEVSLMSDINDLDKHFKEINAGINLNEVTNEVLDLVLTFKKE